MKHRIFTIPFAKVYPLYVEKAQRKQRTKAEKKGRTRAELDEVIRWLTGFGEAELSGHLAAGTTFEDYLRRGAPQPERRPHQGRRLRRAGGGRRGPPDAEDPLPGQAGRRAREGPVDGENPPLRITGWTPSLSAEAPWRAATPLSPARR